MKPCHFDKHGRMRILAIDDDQVNLMVIETVLRPCGWDIVTAMDGDEAYAAVEEGDTWPDLVLLDYNLEVGDSGEVVLAKLRRTFSTANVPIVMCTAMSANSVELDRCLQAGAADILLKPYERSRVMDVVSKHCPGKTATAAPKPAPAPAAVALPPAATPSMPAPKPAPVAASPPVVSQEAVASIEPDVASFCSSLGLEYIGKKLKEQGVSLQQLSEMDDAGLRKLGVVVKAQRDKLLEAARMV